MSAGRGFWISVITFGSTVKLFNCYHKFLCNSVAFHCDRCFTFFDSLYNTLAVYSCNFFIAACICNLACRCCFGSDGCCFTFFDRCRRFYKTECRILDNYFADCLQGSCLCCNRNGSCFDSFYNTCFTVYGCNLCVAACVFYSCRWCCSCFYSCCFSFVDRYGSLCEFNCRSFYCYLAGCCGISDLCCDNCCSGFYAFNNTLAAYRCNLCVAGLKCYCCIAVICCCLKSRCFSCIYSCCCLIKCNCYLLKLFLCSLKMFKCFIYLSLTCICFCKNVFCFLKLTGKGLPGCNCVICLCQSLWQLPLLF